MKRLYYVQGGGLGHIRRTMAVLHTLNLKPSEVVLLTSSRFACEPYIAADLSVIKIPADLATQSKAYRHFLLDVLLKENFQELWTDAFPFGLVGEWADFPFPYAMEQMHIARLLHWGEYSPYLPTQPQTFQQTYFVETLAPAQADFLATHSQNFAALALNYPAPQLTPEQSLWVEKIRKISQPIALIVHSTPLEEIETLLLVANQYYQNHKKESSADVLYWVISPLNPPKNLPACVQWHNFFPAEALFPYVDSIFTACGFNLMQETKPFANKHIAIPFERKYDNQLLRYKNRFQC